MFNLINRSFFPKTIRCLKEKRGRAGKVISEKKSCFFQSDAKLFITNTIQHAGNNVNLQYEQFFLTWLTSARDITYIQALGQAVGAKRVQHESIIHL